MAAASYPSRQAIIGVLEADDIILAEIDADLNLDQFERDEAGIGEAVHGADRDVGRFILVQDARFVIDGDLAGALYDDPVLRSMDSVFAARSAGPD